MPQNSVVLAPKIWVGWSVGEVNKKAFNVWPYASFGPHPYLQTFVL